MRWFYKLRLRVRSLFRRGRVEQELSDELRFHLERVIEENVAKGMTSQKAGYAALREMGGMDQIKEECRDMRKINFLDNLVQDVRYALRMLRRNLGFTAVAVLSLALGIGANALVFSVVNALLLRPLPVERPDQLAFLETKNSGIAQSFPNYRDLRDRNKTFSGLVGHRLAPMELESASGATRLWGLLATGNYFDVLGVRPVMGRFFHQADDLHPGASPYAVLSYNAWWTRFGADHSLVGKTIRINRLPYIVLGVAPPDFHGTEVWYWPEVWVPMMMEPQIENYSGAASLDNRSTCGLVVLQRLLCWPCWASRPWCCLPLAPT